MTTLEADGVRVGDRVRVLEIHESDDCPESKVGDEVSVAWVSHCSHPGFVLISSSLGTPDSTCCRVEVLPRAKVNQEFPLLAEPSDLGAAVVDACEQAAALMVPDAPTEAELAVLASPHRLPDDAPPVDDGRKVTNPKDAVAVAHLKFSAVPVRVLAGVALAMSEGAWKYGRHNYRKAGVRASVYFDALLDHLFAWFEGEDIDPDSGRHHLDKALAGLFVLRDAQLNGMCTDDRPPAIEAGWIGEGHKATAELFARMARRYPEPKAPFVREP